MHKLIALGALLLVAACGSGNNAQDMSVNVLSACGHPGDTGNGKGVGKFCTGQNDCVLGGMATNFCSAFGNAVQPSADDTYFCTIYPCNPDAGVVECGENATCLCGSQGGTTGCACTPNSCLH